MSRATTLRSGQQQSKLTLHRVLKQYKEQQNENQTLINRLKMFRMNEIKMENKFLSMDKQIEKLRKIKQEYHDGKMLINGVVGQRDRKIKDQNMFKHTKIRKEKQRTSIAKNYTLKSKKSNYQTTREERQKNEKRIEQNKLKNYFEKKKLSTTVRQSEQLGRTKAEIYRKKKLQGIRTEHQQHIAQVASKNIQQEEEIKKLRTLEQSMVEKFSHSMMSIRSSRAKTKRKHIKKKLNQIRA